MLQFADESISLNCIFAVTCQFQLMASFSLPNKVYFWLLANIRHIGIGCLPTASSYNDIHIVNPVYEVEGKKC